MSDVPKGDIKLNNIYTLQYPTEYFLCFSDKNMICVRSLVVVLQIDVHRLTNF